ncbi:sulfatase-like hydrolase/transferase [Novosphingobium flavum]|uniref:sulfatase-like hydrolase/transferase n=1 Tax=Novosphingobium aerophilum TaxID=2839843 RepID=UPI00163969A9|nr:sulfatase-like hydrolase/transferase [Novosphingobium aerophilum]MBC2663510.1 sulfatase-like hydrolase/transferase [Novosphingobium aerophilum]
MSHTRRQAMALGALGLGAAGLTAASGQTPRAMPNILWLVSEDNNPYVGAYGDRLAHTPHIDALAKKGVLFRNAYSNAPVCAPSRFAMLTGINPESCSPAQHMRAEAKLPKAFRTYPELMRAAGYFCINNPKTDYNSDVAPAAIWDIQGIEGHWRKAPKGKPFLCVLNTGTSHESQLCAAKAGAVTPDQVRIPAFLPDDPVIRQDYATYYNIMTAMDQEIGNWLAQLEADGLADDTIVFYYGDNGGVLPRSKRYCYEEGLRVPLVVYVPPKWRHLAPAAPGSTIDAPVTLIDLPPTLLSIAGVAQPPQMTGSPLLGLRVGRRRQYAFGFRDRMDERYDLVRTVTDGRWRYIRNYLPHRPLGQHVGFEWSVQKSYRQWNALHLAGKLDARQDAFFQPKVYEELYDLTADPDEVNNLIASPASAPVAARLRRALDQHMLAINDNGFLPEGSVGEGYFASRDRAVYPLPALMRLAAAAARREPRNVNRFRQLLRSPNEATRFWAARGLLMLGGAAAPARPDLEAALAADPSDHVRIVVAETLVGLGKPQRAVEVLARLADEPSPLPVRIQAFDALSCIGAAALPALPVIRKTARSTVARDAEYPKRMATYLEAVLTGAYDPMAEGLSEAACQGSKKGGTGFMGPAESARWPS